MPMTGVRSSRTAAALLALAVLALPACQAAEGSTDAPQRPRRRRPRLPAPVVEPVWSAPTRRWTPSTSPPVTPLHVNVGHGSSPR